jgi:hypothetical protein
MSKKNVAAKSVAAATKPAAAPPSKAVAPKPVAPAPVAATTTQKTITLTRSPKPRKGSSLVYTSPDLKGTVKFPASAFTVAPDSLTLDGAGFASVAAKVKMTPEERKAARAAMTPAMKVENERKRIERAQARVAKLEAAAASA